MTVFNQKKFKQQRGVSMVETMLVLPIMLMLGFGIVHGGLVFQARSNLEYAALMAARVGASTSINIDAMRDEVIKRMGASRAVSDTAEPLVEITVLNPTRAMFVACGRVPTFPPNACAGTPLQDRCEIPNFGLQFRADFCGSASIQDANLLRIKVSYLYDSRVPFINKISFRSPENEVGGEQAVAGRDGIWVYAFATVRMQSPARLTNENQAAIED